jgi:hypothetical protein
MKIRVISLRQPFAELVVSGRKKIETRTWNTKYRGEVYIHASQTLDKKACKELGIDCSKLVRGAIIGKAVLKNAIKYKSNKEFLKDRNKHLVSMASLRRTGWVDKIKYGFVMENPQKIKPILMKGKLGIFEADI